MKEAAKTLIFLQECGVTSYADLEKRAAESSAEFSTLSERIKAADMRMTEIAEFLILD